MRKIAIVAVAATSVLAASGALAQQANRSPSDTACAALSSVEVEGQKPRDFRANRLALTKCELAITQGFRNSLGDSDRRITNLDKRITKITAQVQKMEK